VRESALQLGRSEGLQFVATADDEGNGLDRACSYLVQGRVPVSSFWTLVAVDEAWTSVVAPQTDGALRSSQIIRENDGNFIIHVGTQLRPGNWLELAGEGPFALAITLYDTTALSGFNAADMHMPSLRREACR
jgi:hypothetical protein